MRKGTENKIRGIEQEYPVSAKVGLNPNMLVDAAIQGLKRAIFSKFVNWDLSAEVSQEEHESKIISSYGSNGCRIYNDLGHLEISSPSYNNPFDAIAYEKASEIYAFIASVQASMALKKKVYVHKNNVANYFSHTHYGKEIVSNTYATHGNIIMERAACKKWERVEKALIPWVITRILFAGSGDVVSASIIEKEGVKFVISPRAMFVSQKSSLSTTVRRGILNTRDQPHASFEYWRFHDIHYEGLRSEYAIFMRDISQAMVIRAFELGLLDDIPEIEDPVRAFKELSLDTEACNWEIKLKNGEKTEAVSILWLYFERIEKMYEEMGEEMSEYDKIGMVSMKELLEKLERRKLEEYVDGIDWVTKLALLVNYEPKKASEGISICNQYALLDENVLAYIKGGEGVRGIGEGRGGSFFDPKESIAFAINKLPKVKWGLLGDRIRYALNNAPENTRDFFRTEMIKRFSKDVRSVNWALVDFKGGKVLLDEPFMLNKEEIGEEIEKGEGLEEILSKAKEIYPDKVIF
ncbi:MAG: proteasome accessory factor PafA2 family protein [Candidatus Methanospirareceae archaeon]